MQPIFPRKNWAINTLIEFRQGDVIYDFCKYFEDPEDGLEKEHLEFQIRHLHTLFEGLKDELNQTIHTSNKLTITAYFEELKQVIDDWNLNNVDFEEISEEINDWNKRKYDEYLDVTSKKSIEYFKQPERIKYAHLEEYENKFHVLFSNGFQTTKVINKNFFCLEETPKLIDIQFIDNYLKILTDVTKSFNSTIAHELKLYDEGKIISDSTAEKSFYDKAIDKIKSNKIITVLLILFLIYGGISEFIKYTKENKENLLGKDGLLHKKKIQKDPKIDSSQELNDSTQVLKNKN